MKGLLEKLLKSLGFSGRDWAALLLALLLAFSIWLIHNLSLKYNDYLTASVEAHCNLDGYAQISSNVSQVVARCRTTGYNVISKDLSRRRVRKISFQPSSMKHMEGDTFYVTSEDLLEYAHLIYGDDVTVEYFASDTLFFRFAKVDHKKVPVVPANSISYRSQYMSVGGLDVTPDSVTIYGEPYRLETVDQVYTQPVKYTDVDADVQGVVGLERIRGVRVSETEVRYSLDVTRYVELKTRVPVSPVNLPMDKEMIVIPSSVEVSLKCSFPLIGDPAKDIGLYVDYEDFQSSLSGKCPVHIGDLPKGVITCGLEPMYVECIVGEK